MVQESTLRLGLEYREIERGLSSVISKLGALNDATGNSDKSMSRLEQRLANAAKSAGVLDRSTTGIGKSITGMSGASSNASRAISKYQADVDAASKATERLSTITKTANGAFRDSANGGRFVSKSDIAELQALEQQGQRAAAALRAIETERQRSLASSATSYNASQASTRQPMTAASPANFVPNTSAVRQYSAALDDATKSTRALNKSAGDVEGLASMRYALYDISTTLAAFGAGIGAAVIKPIKTAIDYQRDYADVLRIVNFSGEMTAKQQEKLRDSFVDLSSAIPVTFGELTKIGTLGAQLGVPTAALDEFAKTVAQFSVVTGISVDQTAEAFGRLAELLDLNIEGGDLDKLSSSIFQVGASSVATEQDIINISTQISAIGKFAGLSAPEIIGFSSALASVGIRPELARGVITRAFTLISSAVSEGGDKLEKFGKISGQTGADFAAQWSSSPAQAFVALLKGINDQGDGAVGALQSIGIAASRDIPSILKLAQNTDLVNSSLAQAEQGFFSGTAASNAFGQVSQTVAAKLQVLSNNFDNLMAAMGASTVGPLSAALDGLNGILKATTDILGNPILSSIAAVALGFGGLVAVLAVLAAGYTAAQASMMAFDLIAARHNALVTTQAAETAAAAAANGGLAASQNAVNAATTGGGLKSFIASLGQMGAAGKAASVGIKALSTALKGIGWAGIAVAAGAATAGINASFSNLVDGITGREKDLTSSIDRIKNKSTGLFSGTDFIGQLSEGGINKALYDFNNTILDTVGIDFQPFHTGASAFQQDMRNIDTELTKLAEKGDATGVRERINEIADATGNSYREVLALLPKTTETLDNYSGAQTAAADATTAGIAAQEDFEDAVGNIGGALDDLASQLFGQTDAAAAFFDAIDKGKDVIANTDLSGVVSDTGDLNLQLATGRDLYGAVRDIASAALDKAKGFADGTAEGQAAANQAIIDGQNAVRDFGTQLGLQGDALQAFVDKYSASPEDFEVIVKLTGLEEAQGKIDSLTAIKDQTLNTEIHLNTPNLPAVKDEIEDTAKDREPVFTPGLAPNRVNDTLDETAKPRTPIFTPGLAPNRVSSDLDGIARPRFTMINVEASGVSAVQYAINSITGKTVYIRAVETYEKNYATGGLYVPAYATGGVHKGPGRVRGPGTGTSDDVNAKLSNGEYVQSAKAVQYYGANFMAALNNLQVPKYAVGGNHGNVPANGSGPIGGITELGPRSMKVLREAIQREVVAQVSYVDAARAVDRGNEQRRNTGEI